MKQNFISRRRFWIKSILVSCFLLLALVINGMAQTPYAQLTFNYDYSSSYSNGGIYYNYYTVQVDFYSDAACTIPVSDPYGIELNLVYKSKYNGGTPTTWGGGPCSPEQVESNYYGQTLHIQDGNNHTINWVELTSGTGYLVGNPVNSPGEWP